MPVFFFSIHISCLFVLYTKIERTLFFEDKVARVAQSGWDRYSRVSGPRLPWTVLRRGGIVYSRRGETETAV